MQHMRYRQGPYAERAGDTGGLREDSVGEAGAMCWGGRDTESRCDTAHLCLTGQGGSGNPSQRPAQD